MQLLNSITLEIRLFAANLFAFWGSENCLLGVWGSARGIQRNNGRHRTKGFGRVGVRKNILLCIFIEICIFDDRSKLVPVYEMKRNLFFFHGEFPTLGVKFKKQWGRESERGQHSLRRRNDPQRDQGFSRKW